MSGGFSRFRPYFMWGFGGGVVGSALLAFLAAVAQKGWPDQVEWDTAMTGSLVLGFAVGVSIGTLIMVAMQLVDRTSSSVRKRIAAEQRDPGVVQEMFLDVSVGEDVEAFQAIGYLANYRDPNITKNMLQMLEKRLKDRQVLTLDRLALVRHAVKCVHATQSESNIEQLKPFARRQESDIGVVVRRMRPDLKEVTLQ